MADKAQKQQIHLKVADLDELITASLAEVVFVSAVAEEAAGLQAGNTAVTWDLSNLEVNSRPVTGRTVKNWLNIVYKHLHDVSYEDTFSPVTNTATLCDLLEFADAVQTKRGVIAACESRFSNVDEDLIMTIQVVGTADVEVFVDGRGYIQLNNFYLLMINSGSQTRLEANEWADLVRQILCQTERLLYIAHKLKLPILLSRTEDFITANLLRLASHLGLSRKPIFNDVNLSESIYSDRVCGVLGFAGTYEIKQHWLQSKHQLKLTLGSAQSNVLQIIQRSDGTGILQAILEVKFNKTFAGYKKGSVATAYLREADGRFYVQIGVVAYDLEMHINIQRA